MNTPMSIVNEFLDLTNNKHDVAGAVELMASDIHFVGPVMELNGAQEYKRILERFLSVHVGWKKLAEFENRSDACVIAEIYIKTPAGSTITLKIAEWFIVRDGKISEHRIYYDPREFMTAFGMQ